MNALHNPVVQIRRSRLAVAVLALVLALVLSATALAAKGYRVWGTADQHPHSGALFTVLSHGFDVQKAHLYIYLDKQPCRWTQASEASHFAAFKDGDSHFRDSGRAIDTMWVDGHFSKAFVAVAGSTAEREYACSYLTTANSAGNFKITSARRVSSYLIGN
jgi:hypothetical protein